MRSRGGYCVLAVFIAAATPFMSLSAEPPSPLVPVPLSAPGEGRRMNVGSAGAELPLAARTLTGQVTDERGNPVADAQVVVVGTAALGSVTNERGEYRIAGVPDSAVTLRVTRVGMRPATAAVAPGTTRVDIRVSVVPLRLNEVVVTGTAGGEQRRAIGNSISAIEATDVTKTGVVTDITQLINTRAPGVVITSGPGVAGSGSRIKIRGRGSIALSSDPVVYVDGIRVESSTGVGFSDDPDRGGRGDVAGRLGDIDPENIERIEIIKGPAAATLYGTEASNGVIQITTKRGRPGRATTNVTTRQGSAWIRDIENRWPTTYARNAANEIVTFNLAQAEKARGTPLFQTGDLQGYGLDMSGSAGENARYYLSAGYNRDEGAKHGNFSRRFNGRANFTATPTQALQLNASMSIGTGGYVAPGGTEMPSYPSDLPLEGNTEGRGTRNRRPPEIPAARSTASSDYDRYIAGFTVNHTPATWFTQRATVGLDISHDSYEFLNRRLTPELARWYTATAAEGSKTVTGYDRMTTTIEYGATVNRTLGTFTSASSAGANYIRKRKSVDSRFGQRFPVPSVTSLGATTGQTAFDDDGENTTLGAYVQEQVGWRDRMFLTGALRMDDNSAFGQNFNAVIYPKLSATWVVSEEPFWNLGLVDALKLRAAWGASGRQPDAFAAVRAYSPVTGTGNRAAVTPEFIGNPDLKPERGEELEAGFDLGMFASRMDLGVTFYDKRTRDALIRRDVAPSSGYSAGFGILGGQQWVNGGSVQNRGVELLLNGRLIERRNFGWASTFSFSSNSNKVLSLPEGVSFIAVDFLQNRFQPGYPAVAFFRKHIVQAEMDANGNTFNVLCDDGSGGAINCDLAEPVYRGNPDPKYEGAFTNTVTLFKQLQLQAVVDFKRGNRLWNVNRWVRCVFDLVCEERVSPEKFDPKLIAEFQQGGGVDYIWETIEDASYTKLREVSATLTLPDRFARRLGASAGSISLAGRNLYTWTKYSGFDPEGAVLSHRNLQEEDNTVPPTTQLVTTIRLTF